MSSRSRFALALTFIAVGCAPPGTRPHDMSTTGHVAAARAEDHEAAQDAREADQRSGHYSECASAETGAPLAVVCWTDAQDTSAEHTAAMQEHRRLAAAHRAAAASLQAAEDRACVGLSEDERDASPFEHRSDIVSVTELTEEVHLGHQVSHRVVGATIGFRGVRGLTREWLERLIECHLARNAALGHDVPEMAECPLVPRGVTAHVSSTDAGFAVEVRADSDEGAAEVLRRARSLVASPHE